MARLDEAFAAIQTAIAAAEKNLENARELLDRSIDSVLSGANNGQGYTPLRDLLSEQPRNGWSPPKRYQTGTGIPVLTLSAVTGFRYDGSRITMSSAPTKPEAHYWLLPGELLVTRSNTTQLVGHVALYDGTPSPAICPDLIMKMTANEKVSDRRYLYYALRSSNVRSYLMENASGASSTMQKIGKAVLQNAPIPLCELDAQKTAADQLDRVASEQEKLLGQCARKAGLLAELKQSLLHEALSGALSLNHVPAEQDRRTIEGTQNGSHGALRLIDEIEGINPTDLHAGILALAFRDHDNAGKLRYLGHVKGEKIAHMVERHVGVSLGRSPRKDAAGPNDYPHLKKVESRARKAGFFTVTKVGERYEFDLGSQFQKLIDKAEAALGERLADVQALLDLLTPLTTQQAEIVATVYAAWNNLLLSGDATPADEAIVREAREDWHPKKLDIPRQKFFKAIDWMRKKELVPRGTGQPVE